MVYTLRFFPLKCSLFHNSNVFRSCIIHILYTGVLKLKKNNSGAKRLTYLYLLSQRTQILEHYTLFVIYFVFRPLWPLSGGIRAVSALKYIHFVNSL